MQQKRAVPSHLSITFMPSLAIDHAGGVDGMHPLTRVHFVF